MRWMFTDFSPQSRMSSAASDRCQPVGSRRGQNADVTVFWRDFDAKKEPGKTDTLTGPAFAAAEGCAVAIHHSGEFLGKGRALVWDERSEQWRSIWPSDVCPEWSSCHLVRQVDTRCNSAGRGK